MKKNFSILVMLIMISSVVLAGGAPGPSASSKMAIVKCGNEVVKVFYKRSEAAKVKVTIYDKNEEVLFSEEVKSKLGFIRPYNFNDLPEGEYRVVMQDENETREEYISTVKEHVKSLAGIIRASKEQVMVTLFSRSDDDLTVTFMDQEKHVLFSKVYSVNGRDAKLFNLRSVKGAASVEVSDRNGIINSSTL